MKENYGKVFERLPEKKFYYYSTFLKSKREEFNLWYREHKHDRFDFSKEIIVYCFNDVDIVDESTEDLRNFFKDLTKKEIGIKKKDGTYEQNADGSVKTEEVFDETFLYCATMPSACTRLYRINFLQRKTVPIMPEGGYDKNGKQSKIAAKYLR